MSTLMFALHSLPMSTWRGRAAISGLTMYEGSVGGKWLAMLKEIDPRVTRAAFIINPKTSSFAHFAREAETMAQSLPIELALSTIENAGDIGRVIEFFASLPNGGLVFPPDATTSAHRDLVVALAARYRLPAVYTWRYFVTAGGLMSYGIESWTSSGKQRPMSIAFCAAARPPSFRYRRRPNTKRS